tara:strand:- start:1825 stop:2139 length:315 start_codon:yes stop_codon:yes gene_type:complete
MTTYANNCGHLQDLISEAHSARVSESNAKIWAKSFIADLGSYEEVKDMAHHYGIGSVEVAHHETVKAQLLEKMVEEMLDPDSADDDDYDDDRYCYADETWECDL